MERALIEIAENAAYFSLTFLILTLLQLCPVFSLEILDFPPVTNCAERVDV